MKKIYHFALAALTIAGAGFMNSCSSDDYHFNPEYAQKTQENLYTQNFVKAFGSTEGINWDFTNGYQLGTRADGAVAYPVAGLDYKFTYKSEGLTKEPKASTIDLTYGQNKAVYDNITKQLPDGKIHTGQSAVLTAPGNGFMVYPVSAQGAYTYDLYVKVGDEEYKVFSKDWTDYSKAYCNGMPTEIKTSSTGYLTNKRYSFTVTKSANMTGYYIEAPAGTPIQIYLKNIKSGKNVVTNDLIGTPSGNAILVDADVLPEGLGAEITAENPDVKFIGIEDTPLRNIVGSTTEPDYNDLVLAIVGNPAVPEEIVVTEDEFDVFTNNTKRYMVEDLGVTDDFDFNDVVLDVTDNCKETYKVTKTNGVITNTELIATVHTQKATIKHLGGDMPFSIFVKGEAGNLVPIVENHTPGYTDLDETHEISGWNPYTNNIVFQFQTGVNKGVYTIDFPAVGATPLMIATTVDRAWADEREQINWLKAAIDKQRQ